MPTPEINENCHYVKNDPHRCKIKLENFTLIACVVMELLRKVSRGVVRRPPGEIGLNTL